MREGIRASSVNPHPLFCENAGDLVPFSGSNHRIGQVFELEMLGA